MTAYGYIRKSVVHDPARMLSPEMQEASIRKLAEANGHPDVVILSDLDVSGRKDRTRRPGWDELLRAVEDGEATAVYAYSLSRFARSVSQLADFFDLAKRKGVRIRVDRDQIDTSTATGQLVANVLASLAQFEADVASERVKDAFAAKRQRDPEWDGPGQRAYGSKPGEDVGVIVGAFRERGSYDGAARLLNELGIPCRVSGAAWSGTVVRAVIQREAPDEVLPYSGRGAPAGKRAFRFSQLIRCSTCEERGVREGSKQSTFLTGSWDKRRGEVRYACSRARIIPHARGWVNEAKLVPAIVDEYRHVMYRWEHRQRGDTGDLAKLEALAAKRARIIDLAADGLIDKADAQRRIAEVAEEEAKLSTLRWVRHLKFPPDIETGDPAKVNAYLRRLFSRVTVDMSEKAFRGPSSWTPTVTFEWRDPSLRMTEEQFQRSEGDQT